MANKQIQTNVLSRFGKSTLTGFGEISWKTDGTAEVSEDVFIGITQSGDTSIFPIGQEPKKIEVKVEELQTPQDKTKEIELNKTISVLTEDLRVVMLKYNETLSENESLKKEYELLQKEAEKLATMVDELQAVKVEDIEVTNETVTIEQEITEMKIAEMLDLAKNLELPIGEYQGLKKLELAKYLIDKTKESK